MTSLITSKEHMHQYKKKAFNDKHYSVCVLTSYCLSTIATTRCYIQALYVQQPPSLQQSLVKEVQVAERKRVMTAESR